MKSLKRLRRRCAWCDRICDKLGTIREGDRISHGICQLCAESEELGRSVAEIRASYADRHELLAVDNDKETR